MNGKISCPCKWAFFTSLFFLLLLHHYFTTGGIMQTPPNSFQMITRLDLEKLTRLSKSTIYERINPKSKRFDANFPQPVKFGHLTRWRLSEVQDWIQTQIDARDF